MESGITIEIGLNRALRFIGSSDLPAYPGLRVMKTAQSDLRATLASSSNTCCAWPLMAV
jgi:hypothetical protein